MAVLAKASPIRAVARLAHLDLAGVNTIQSDTIKPCRAVLVLGMHRSGTSVLSRALIALGVDFGGSFVDVKPDNPKGFFEDKDVNELNVSFLQAAGCHWYSLVLPQSYPSETETDFKKQAAALIKKKFASSPLWGLKDPRITRLSGLWESVISEINASAYYVLATRNPLSVADSLAKRDDIPRAQALALWMLHQINGLQAIIRNRGLIIDYDLMMNQPSNELKRLALFLEKDIDEENKNNFEDDFLDQGLRHSYHTNALPSDSPLTKACLSFHYKLVELAQSQGPLERSELDAATEILHEAQRNIALHNDWLYALDAVYRKVERAKHDLQEKEVDVRRLRSDLTWLEANWLVRFAIRLKGIL